MRRWAGLVAVLVCAAGCSSGGRDPAVAEESLEPLPTVREAAEPVPGIEAEAVRLRTDVAVGDRIQVQIAASDTFIVTSVALDSPGFASLPARELSTEFEPGQVTNLPVRFGRVECDVAPEPASARLTVVRDGGAAEEVEVPLAAAVLVDVHTEKCREQALAQQVTVEVTGLRPDGDALRGSLTLVRRSGIEEVQLSALRRSVLMAVEAELPLTMDGGAPEASTEVRFAPATCEPHVLAETKQPFLFPATVQVGTADPVTVGLPIADDVRTELQDLVQRVCG